MVFMKSQMMQTDLSKEPVSTANPAFLNALRVALVSGGELIFLKRLDRCGGAKQVYHVTSLSQAESILNKSKPADSFTVFFPPTFPLRGKTEEAFAKSAFTYFQSLGDEKDWGAVVRLGGGTEQVDYEYVASQEEIRIWFEEHPGIDVAIGTMNFCKANCDEVLTAYIPDPDGVVRPGAY
jgi:hypothetical protein